MIKKVSNLINQNHFGEMNWIFFVQNEENKKKDFSQHKK